MADERQHHKSKKIRYDLLLVPSGDAGESRRIRFSLWQVIALLSGSIIVVVGVVLLILIYTPLGGLVPISNPELENRYGKQIVGLSERMTGMAEQMVVLSEYNTRLRRALGEKPTGKDSLRNLSSRSSTLDDASNRSENGQKREGQSKTVNPSQRQSGTTEQLRNDPRVTAFPVIMPTEGYISRRFDPARNHFGLDIAGKTGTLVQAAADGNIVFAGWTSDDGYKVIISHAGGYLTFYKHNQFLLRTPGAFVRRGEAIAHLGNTGETSAGPHLHFEIWKDGSPVNPSQYMLNYNF
ncbi:MAG: M23 family metallopeptidase [bacterium]